MLGPNHHTYHVANQAYQERLSHAALIRMVQKERQDETRPFHAEGHRLITTRRLAAGLAGVVLTFALAAGGAGIAAASPSHAGGGGATLMR